MKRRHLLLLVATLTVGLGTALVGHSHLATQREHTQLLARQNANAARQLTALRRQRDSTARDLALAEQQLARLPTIALVIDRPPTRAPDSATTAWLARAQQLHSLASENPGHHIPEMKLLTDDDWMRVAQHAAFETDDQRRAALAALRTTAKDKFIARLSAAAQKWTLASGVDQRPATMVELTSSFGSTVDPAILPRYEIVAQSNPRSRFSWRAQETAAIDEDYDTRAIVEANGSYGSSGPGPLTWNSDYTARLQGAYRAYASTHLGSPPPRLAQIIPYIDPPLPPATLEKLLQAERAGPR